MNDEVETTTQAITVSQPAPLPQTEFNKSYNSLVKFVKGKLKENVDYGIIPGTKKKSLFKPGAEKIAFLFGLSPTFELITSVEDFNGNFIYFKYKCKLIHNASGRCVGEAVRSCNSKEAKYRTKTTADVANTVDAMAQKRACVAAVVQATMATEIFDVNESELDNEAPNKPVTKSEDPVRIKALGALFKSGKERGFSQDEVKAVLYQKYSVDTTTKISTNQLKEATDSLIQKFDIVEVGQPPKPFNQETTASRYASVIDATSPNIEVTVTEDPKPLPWEQTGETDASNIISGEIVEDEAEGKVQAVYCRNENIHGKEKVAVPADSPYTYFCSENCERDYHKSTDSKLQNKADSLRAKMKGANK